MAFFSLLVTVLLLSCASAERVSGNLQFDDATRFAFMGKFAFDFSHNCTDVTLDECNRFSGQVNLNLSVPASGAGNLDQDTGMRVLFFDDQIDSWFTVYKQTELSCQQVVNRSITPDRNQILFETDTDGNWVFINSAINIKQHLRPRFWYVGVSDCNNVLANVTTEFDMKLENTQEGPWTIEFGVDQMGLNTLFIVFFCIYLLMMSVQIYNVFVFKRDGMLHPMIQLFVISMSLQFAGMICQMIHWTRFTNGGVGVPFLNIFGDVFTIFAHLSFMLLLILIAQGWTITENAIYHRKQLLGGLLFFCVLYVVALFLKHSIDPASTSYTFSSVPGIMAAALNAVAGIWFLYSILKSYKVEADIYKQHLYVKVAIIFAAWFWALPLELVIAAISSPWLRDIIVTTLSLVITTAGYTVMVYLLWPSRAANYFAVTVTSNMQMASVNNSGLSNEQAKAESINANMLSESDYNQL